MKPIDTGKAYDTIVHRWSDDRFNMKNGIAQHQKAITFTKSRGKALDVGCGRTGRFLDLLISEGFEPEGLDVSEGMIRLARERHPELTFYHDDICSFEFTQKYDFITAWDSIWHVPLEQQESVLTKLANGLNPGGVLIFSFGGVDIAGDHTDDTMGPMMYYATLGVNGCWNTLVKNNCAVKHLEFDQYPELHTYFIAQRIT